MSTIADVAKLAGVSTGTVSRVLNRATNVNPDTRSKVEQAIATLGYQPNLQARSLRSNRTDMIALAIPELTNYFWTTVARGVQEAAQSSGYHVLICETFERSSQGLRYLASIYNRVDGMIISRRSEWAVLTGEDVQPSRTAVTHDKPIAVVSQSKAASWNVDNVYSDSISASFALTEHLIRLRRSTIAIVAGRQSSSSASDRVAGYCMALANAGRPIDPDLICWGEYERQASERLTDALLERRPDITAIVAANNEIAVGVLRALEKRQLKVPDAVAVVCFDDFYPDSRYASLVTVAAQSPYDIGINVAQLLLNRLGTDQYLHPQTVILPMRLIVRQSCGGIANTVEADQAYDRAKGQLIMPLPHDKIEAMSAAVQPFAQATLPPKNGLLPRVDRAPVTLLHQTLQATGSVVPTIPHFEYAITNAALYRYVLEREPQDEWVGEAALISPEDQVEFARRSRIAAIACRFPTRPALNSSSPLSFAFAPFTEQITFFERYIRAAQTSGVGVVADFRAIVADTVAFYQTLTTTSSVADIALLEKIADSLVHYQRKVVQLICDRFGSDLVFVLFSDQWADGNGLSVPQGIFERVFRARLEQLLHPAKEYGLSAVLYTPGKLEPVMPLIQQIGFDAVYVADPVLNDLAVLNQITQGRLAFLGGIPDTALYDFDECLIEDQVMAAASLPVSGSRYVAGVAPAIGGTFPVENYPALLRVLSLVKRR